MTAMMRMLAVIAMMSTPVMAQSEPPALDMPEDGGEIRSELDAPTPPGAPIVMVQNVSYALLVATVTGRVQGPLVGISFAPQLVSPSSVCTVVVDIFTCVVTRSVGDSQSQILTITATGPRGSRAVVQALTYP